MKKTVEKFSLSLMADVFQESSGQANSQLLRVVQERWRQSNRRGHGHYAKAPDTSIMNNLRNSLITSSLNINEDLLIPQLSIEHCLNISIGLLLSIKTPRDALSSTNMQSPLLIDIISFVKNWISASKRLKPPKKMSNELNRLLNIQFSTSIDFTNNSTKQISNIIHKILLPIISCSILIRKIYYCNYCNYTINSRCNLSYIEISMIESQFRLNQQLENYFINNTSDHKCDKCGMMMSREIKIIDCKLLYASAPIN